MFSAESTWLLGEEMYSRARDGIHARISQKRCDLLQEDIIPNLEIRE